MFAIDGFYRAIEREDDESEEDRKKFFSQENIVVSCFQVSDDERRSILR